MPDNRSVKSDLFHQAFFTHILLTGNVFLYERSVMKYGLIGEHLGHSCSSEIHRMLGNPEYGLQEIDREKIDDWFASPAFSGINVTIPYKKNAFEHCDFVEELAKDAGAVNCVVNKDGALYGYNTDCAGIEATLDHAGIDVSGKTVLVAGRGGAAGAVNAVLRKRHADIVTVYHRPAEGCVLPELASEKFPDASVIINATPAGMYPNAEGQSIDLKNFKNLEFVFDLVYDPLKTQLLQQAEELGIPCSNGLRMLVMQAVKAHEHFMDTSVDESVVIPILESLACQRINIVLTGMSSCGKSTLGKAAADKLGLEFIDMDTEIEKEIQMSIPEYFEAYGEAAFRDVETAVARRLSLLHGKVIATGGGIIERPENIPLLKRNGIIVFIDRSPELLVKDDEGRPMMKKGFDALYTRRKPVYENTADFIVSNNSDEADGLETLETLVNSPAFIHIRKETI